MNGRIQELMDQCEEPYSTQNYPCWDMEKFAELIVRECLVQISEALSDTNCSASGAYKTAKLATMSRVKEHFGVQE